MNGSNSILDTIDETKSDLEEKAEGITRIAARREANGNSERKAKRYGGQSESPRERIEREKRRGNI